VVFPGEGGFCGLAGADALARGDDWAPKRLAMAGVIDRTSVRLVCGARAEEVAERGDSVSGSIGEGPRIGEN